MIGVRTIDLTVAAGIVLAGVVLWRMISASRMEWLRRLRWIVAAVAAYGAASFVHAALSGTSLRAAVTGDGLFRVLPFVVQGTFLGAFLILPLGWIASVVRFGIPRLRPGSVASPAFQAVALSVCIVLLITSVAQSPGPSASSSRSLSPQERTAMLDRSLHAIADGDRDGPGDTWDPDYVVSMVGRDPQALFRWVQDNTYWIPYRGVLRGAVGVLMDRQGNSLDRALLLAALLERAGHTVRLAHGELSRDDAVAMLPGMISERAVDFSISEGTNSRPSTNLRAAAMQYSLDGRSIEQTLAAQEQAMNRISSELDARVEDQTKRLLQAAAPIGGRDEWLKRFEDNVVALRDHWWVQRLDLGKDGQRWIDFDLLIGGDRSAALTAAKETPSLNDLAADVYQQVAIRVIAEQWSAGTVREYKALEHVLRPADAIGQPIVLQFMPTDWLADSAPAMQLSQDIRAAVLSQREWAAGLTVGRKEIASAILHDSGEQAAAHKGGAFGGFGAALDNTLNTPSGRGNKILSAVWIEYEIRVPGEKARTIRRTVFDLIGPTARQAGNPALRLDDDKKITRGFALGMKTEILPVVCQFAPEFVAHETAQAISADRDLLGSITSPDFSVDSETTKHQLEQATPPVSPLVGLAYTRLEWNHSRDHIFINRPNILTRHQFLQSISRGIALDNAIDIVANEVGVDLSAPNAYAVRVQQGVRDTNNEALLFGGGGTGNTGSAFADSSDWLTITPAQLSSLNGLGFSENTRRRMAEDLEGGYVVVTPKAPVRRRNEDFAGWWRIDPQTGDALGVAENGWGQELEEEDVVITGVLRFARAFLWENGMCHVYSQAVNSVIVIKELLVGDWHPSWTGPGTQSKDPREVYQDSKKMCLIQAIVAGFVATLPLLLITLRNSRNIRGLRALEEAEELAPRRNPPGQPCSPVAMAPFGSRAPLAAISAFPLVAMFAGTLPCVPGNGPPHANGPKVDPKPPEQNPKPPEQNPKPKDPCEQTGGKGPAEQPPSPRIADLERELADLDQQLGAAALDYIQKRSAYADAVKAWMEKMDVLRRSLPAGWEGTLRLDPASEATLQQARDESIRAANRVKELGNAIDIAKEELRIARRTSEGNTCGPVAGGRGNANSAPNLNSPPEKVLPPNVGNTQPGMGPPDPITDPKGPPTVHDPHPPDMGPHPDPITDPKAPPKVPDQHRIPGDASPFADTQPNLSAPVAPPPTLRSPSGTLPGQGPSGTPEEPMPPTEPGGPPTRRGPPRENSGGPPTQRSPQNSGPPASPSEKTMVGLGGVLDSLGGPK